MRLALAQLNVVVGDLDGNRAKILDRLADARDAGADLVVYPELAVHGLPARGSPPPPRLHPRRRTNRSRRSRGRRQASSRSSEHHGSTEISRTPAPSARTAASRAIYRKHFLPNYGVFDEHRYFAEGRDLLLLRMGDVYLGPTICEDLWQPGPPATDLALAGAQLVVNLSASPFHVGKAEEREEMLVTRARDTSSYLAFCNLVGGQDELVFDGHSVVLDDAGEVVARAPGFEEHLLVVDVEPDLAIGRRLRDVRRRELDRSRESVPAGRDPRARSARARAREGVATGRWRRSSRSSSRCGSGSSSGCATTSRRADSRRSSSGSRAGSTLR